jgi:hypothetical protein
VDILGDELSRHCVGLFSILLLNAFVGPSSGASAASAHAPDLRMAVVHVTRWPASRRRVGTRDLWRLGA